MKTLDFIKSIPYIIRAKNPEQLQYLLLKAYTDDNLDKTTVFARGTDRFYIVKTWGVRNPIGWLAKRHVLKALDLMNKSHKPELLSTKDKINLDKQVKSLNRSLFSNSISGTQARNADWSS